MTAKRRWEIAAGLLALLVLGVTACALVQWERQRRLDAALAAEVDEIAMTTEHTRMYAVAPLDKAWELVRKGANVRVRGRADHTRSRILDWAAAADDAGFVGDLIDRGADPNAPDAYGSTPLISAAIYGSANAVEELLHHGAQVDARDESGQTALFLAAYGSYGGDSRNKTFEDYPRVVQLLLEKGTHVNAADNEGVTPLMAAAEAGNLGTVEILLSAGARRELRDKKGKAALDHAGEALAYYQQVAREPYRDEQEDAAQLRRYRRIIRLLLDRTHPS